VRVVQGIVEPFDDALPNWTELNEAGTLIRGRLIWGTNRNGSGLSGYISNFAPGEYNLSVVPTGTLVPVDGPVPGNLLPGAKVCLRSNTFHTVVISDTNNQHLSVSLAQANSNNNLQVPSASIRVYTDSPCCCPERCKSEPQTVPISPAVD
jgi:hypothetical protein